MVGNCECVCVCEGDIFAKSNHDSREEIGDGRNTYVIIFNERHNSSGLQRGRGKNEHLQITREDRNVSLTPHPQCSNHSKKNMYLPFHHLLDGNCPRARNVFCSPWCIRPCFSCTWSLASRPTSHIRRSIGCFFPSRCLGVSWRITSSDGFRNKNLNRTSLDDCLTCQC